MKQFIAPMAILVLLVVGRAVSASETIGWITVLDEENDRIVLDSGQSFALSEDINFSSLSDGRRVRVTYETIAGIPTVTGVVAMPSNTFQAESPTLDDSTPVCLSSTFHSKNVLEAERTRLFC